MKTNCPKCEAVYNIDDAKIPEKGAVATCKKCQARFRISKQETPAASAVEATAEAVAEATAGVVAEAVSEEAPKDTIISCPYCSHVNISTEKCAGCGKIFSEEEKTELTVHI